MGSIRFGKSARRHQSCSSSGLDDVLEQLAVGSGVAASSSLGITVQHNSYCQSTQLIGSISMTSGRTLTAWKWKEAERAEVESRRERVQGKLRV